MWITSGTVERAVLSEKRRGWWQKTGKRACTALQCLFITKRSDASMRLISVLDILFISLSYRGTIIDHRERNWSVHLPRAFRRVYLDEGFIIASLSAALGTSQVLRCLSGVWYAINEIDGYLSRSQGQRDDKAGDSVSSSRSTAEEARKWKIQGYLDINDN